MIKIIGGKYKRSNLFVPKTDVRPTSSMIRESIFSILESYALRNSIEIYKNKAVLDIFAGSGSLGLEAISRGAKEVFFYENDNEVVKILEKNCSKICKENNYEIVENDVITFPPEKNQLPVSIIFLDPPYNKYDVKGLLDNIIINKIIKKNTIIVFETLIDFDLCSIKKLDLFDKRIYGKTKINFFKLSK